MRPSRFAAYAIFVPSGDQVGRRATPGTMVARPVPSAFTTAMSDVPVWNAIFFPSGENDGTSFPPVGVVTTFVAPDPSGSIVQIWLFRTNAIFPFVAGAAVGSRR